MFECFFDGLRMSGGYLLFSAPNLRNTYIKPLAVPQQIPFKKLSQIVERALKQFLIAKTNFSSYLSSKYDLIKLPRKLENWHELEFGEFIKELNKAIKSTNKTRAKEAVIILDEKEERHETTPYEVIQTLTKKDEFEWMELFEENKKKAQELQTQITATDKEIDQMVYELYGLTDDEIKIVENS